MPNWVMNQLTIEGEDLGRLKKHFTEGGEFDFNTILPMPEDLNIEASTDTENGLLLFLSKLDKDSQEEFTSKYAGIPMDEIANVKLGSNEDEVHLMELGKKCYENINRYGYSNWYDWRMKNWNVKWNASDTWCSDDFSSISFNTPWNVPYGVMQKFANMYPDLTITHTFAEENIGCFDGRFVFWNGAMVEGSKIYDDYSKEAYEVAFDLWGERENYVFDDATGTYKYIEEDGEEDTDDKMSKN